MVDASCHCGAVHLTVAAEPETVTECSCSICRRYGVLWAYYPPSQVTLSPPAGATDIYMWDDRSREFHRCKVCGCMTHMAAADIGHVFGVNARMMPALDPAGVTVIQMDNSHSGWFWTKSDQPVRQSHHPHMPMPSAEDWR